jgi:hypothetical protein
MENLLPWTKPSVVPAPPHIWRETAAVDVTGYAVEADGTPWQTAQPMVPPAPGGRTRQLYVLHTRRGRGLRTARVRVVATEAPTTARARRGPRGMAQDGRMRRIDVQWAARDAISGHLSRLMT